MSVVTFALSVVKSLGHVFFLSVVCLYHSIYAFSVEIAIIIALFFTMKWIEGETSVFRTKILKIAMLMIALMAIITVETKSVFAL